MVLDIVNDHSEPLTNTWILLYNIHFICIQSDGGIEKANSVMENFPYFFLPSIFPFSRKHLHIFFSVFVFFRLPSFSLYCFLFFSLFLGLFVIIFIQSVCERFGCCLCWFTIELFIDVKFWLFAHYLFMSLHFRKWIAESARFSRAGNLFIVFFVLIWREKKNDMS